MKVENLESAMDEMFDFITDLPSGLDGFESDFKEAFAELEKVKSDDVVEVVRCKDCCYRSDCAIHGSEYCVWYESLVDTNDFCSAGKRKLED